MIKKLNEIQLNPPDIKAVFKTASDTRSKPTGFRRFYPKDKIDFNDLQQIWKEAGFPDDSRDIARILLSNGFSKKEINKVFDEVFETEDESQDFSHPAVMKIANYAKEKGYDKDLIEFLKSEYNFKESYSYEGKVVLEQIKSIFNKIVFEERTDLQNVKQSFEIENLGRNKK